ncbi:hypothetical protein [Oceanobacillus arenosus]|uniref:hypothetical protein n=1 Tax=Oceanobacillus arenosus TaxID=1229153 RepID=UPI001B86A7DF|nr:hypothetical protein [Oceanobacillus arenosus]
MMEETLSRTINIFLVGEINSLLPSESLAITIVKILGICKYDEALLKNKLLFEEQFFKL